MSNENEKKLKYCVYCGAKTEGKAYCPKCGKLVIQDKPKVEELQSEKISTGTEEIPRKCSGCGSIISSTILEQCPICNTILEPIPEYPNSMDWVECMETDGPDIWIGFWSRICGVRRYNEDEEKWYYYTRKEGLARTNAEWISADSDRVWVAHGWRGGLSRRLC